jgi:hypothetical protein
MPKLIIAIDLGDKPGRNDVCWFSKFPAPSGAEPRYVTDPTDLKQVQVNDRISFDQAYLEIDVQDNSFYVAEFRGWEE